MKKRKRINPIEANIEKIVLGGVSVVLLGVVAMQFLTNPNDVQIGDSSQKVSPDRVFDAAKDKAAQLLAKMNDSQPTLPEIPSQDVKSSFDALSRQVDVVASNMQLHHFGEAPKIDAVTVAENAADASASVYVLPALPEPVQVAAAMYRGTVDPMEWVQNKAIRQYLPSEQPFDVAAVSVEGSISGTKLRESLQVDPDGEDGPMRPMPLSWWRGGLEILGVEAERQELDASGNWVNPTIISSLPGHVSLLDEARQPGLTPLDLQAIVQDAAQAERDIVEPAFLPVIAGPEWVEPRELGDEGSMSEEQIKINRLQKQLKKVDGAIARLEDQLSKVGPGSSSSGGNVDRPGGRNRTTGGGGRRGGGGEGGGGGGGGSTRDPGRLNDQKRQNLQLAIEKQQRIRDRIVDQLDELGVSLEEDQNAGKGKSEAEKPLPGLLDAEDLAIWVHDVTAEPGRTYRYHIRAVVNNPLFGRGLYLSESQQEAAKSAVIEGPWSAWSEPIVVAEPQQYFVVSASENDNLGNGPRAAVEVYKFYYGYWRKGSATLEPGDTIHANAKLPEGLLVWDLAKLEELGTRPGFGPAGRPGGGGRPGEFRGPGGRPGMVSPGNERFRAPEGEGEIPSMGRTGRERNPSGQRRDEKQPLPEGASELPRDLTMQVQAMLLDVASLPGANKAQQAVLRGSNGGLFVRRADLDRANELYRRVVASARAGAEQNKAEEPDKSVAPNPRDMPGRDFEEGNPEGGGPGGG